VALAGGGRDSRVEALHRDFGRVAWRDRGGSAAPVGFLAYRGAAAAGGCRTRHGYCPATAASGQGAAIRADAGLGQGGYADARAACAAADAAAACAAATAAPSAATTPAASADADGAATSHARAAAAPSGAIAHACSATAATTPGAGSAAATIADAALAGAATAGAAAAIAAEHDEPA
jgi:hypothetical protein